MRKIQHILCLLITLLTLASCGEDRSGEYYSKVEKNIWMEEIMLKYYLWYDNIPTIKEDNYFDTPSDFLKKLVYDKALGGKGDSFSYVISKEKESRSFIDKNSTYGFDFELMTDPLGKTTHVYARVLYVLPNSPAIEAGLKRGDWISAVGENDLTADKYKDLVSGQATRFARKSIITTGNEPTWSTVDSVYIGASRYIEPNPFYIDTVYKIDNKKIAYMMYNAFSTGPTDQPGDTEYTQQMLQIFGRFKSELPDAFILDLRYNPGGYLSCAQELGSLLAPASALNQPFFTLKYNNITTPQEVSYKLNSQLAGQNLNLNKIYILTTQFTASASEAIINCLRPYMGTENVIQVGETTVGKPVAMESYGYSNDSIDITLWPVVAYVLNSEGKANYDKGLTPTFLLNERNLTTLLPLGDTQEYLLKNTLSYITTGAMPDVGLTTQSARVKGRSIYNSISRKPQRNIIP